MALNRLRAIRVSADSKESSYDTAAVMDSLIKVDNASIPSPVIEAIDDSDHVGGTEEPSDQEIISQSATMTFSQTRVKPHTLAFLAGYGLGSPAAAASTSAGSAYRHSITPLTAATLPSFTLDAEYIDDSADTLEKKFSGGIVNSFTLNVDRGSNRFMNVSADLIFSGTIAAGSTASSTEPSEGGLNAGATTGVWYGSAYDGAKPTDLSSTAHQTTDLTSSTDLSSALRSFTWNFSNNIDPQELYRIGGGISISDSERTARTQTIEFTLDVDNWDYVDDLTGESNQAFQILVRGDEIDNGDYYGINLIFPKIRIADISFAEQNGKVVQNVTARVLQDSTYGSVLLDVFNSWSAGYAQ